MSQEELVPGRVSMAVGRIRRDIDDLTSTGSTRLDVTRNVSSERGQGAECGSSASLPMVLACGIECVLVCQSF